VVEDPELVLSNTLLVTGYDGLGPLGFTAPSITFAIALCVLPVVSSKLDLNIFSKG
jgi:hypothetical protein